MGPVVALATVNGRAYYALTKELKKRGLSFIEVVPGNEVPAEAEVIISTDAEKNLLPSDKPIVTFRGSAEEAVDEAIQAALKSGGFDEIVIGVDPGKRYGIAVVGDGKLIKSLSLYDPDSVVEEVKRVLARFRARRALVRVGDGAPTYRDAVLDKLFILGVSVELVSEVRTTSHRRSRRDEEAAWRIAAKKGRRVR